MPLPLNTIDQSLADAQAVARWLRQKYQEDGAHRRLWEALAKDGDLGLVAYIIWRSRSLAARRLQEERELHRTPIHQPR